MCAVLRHPPMTSFSCCSRGVRFYWTWTFRDGSGNSIVGIRGARLERPASVGAIDPGGKLLIGRRSLKFAWEDVSPFVFGVPRASDGFQPPLP